MLCHHLGVGQILGNELGNSDLVDPEIWVRGYDCSTREVHSFAREVASKSPLLSFLSLDKSSNRFSVLRLLQTGDVAVDVESNLKLQVVPLFHYALDRGTFGKRF